MTWLRNFVYLSILAVVWPLLAWRAWKHGKYRDGWSAKFLGQAPQREGDRPCIWFHAVSVGEVNLLAPILSRWEILYPDWDVVISTTTRTGFELANKKYGPRTVFYAPLDFSWAVDRALARVRPTLLVLAELEVWPNQLEFAERRGVPVAVINGRLSDKSFRGYSKIRGWLQPAFAKLSLVAAQNDSYASRFTALGAESSHVHITGSIKFDGVNTERDNPLTQKLAAAAGIQDDDFVFLAGSTQESEEAAALDAFEQIAPGFPETRLILVPRHPERFADVAKFLRERKVRFQLRSELDKHGPDPQVRVLLVDAVGELGGWWGTAHAAFVGGSLTRRGGQNMIEPAAYGAAVCVGPNTWNFRDVVERMLKSDAAVVVRDTSQLTNFLHLCLAKPQYAADLGRRARELVLQQRGAADRTIELMQRLLPDAKAPVRGRAAA